MNKQVIIENIISNKINSDRHGFAVAPVNIALCKYWGKRDAELNLPVTSSLSVSLGEKYAFTEIYEIAADKDQIAINDQAIADANLINFLNLFRPTPNTHYQIKSSTNIPIAAGLASSASGYAAITKALNDLYQWNLTDTQLSILARLGSGSACRSIWNGFVKWQKGEQADGMDSYGVPIDTIWPELRIGLQIVSTAKKPISSRLAMQRTVETSDLYKNWPTKISHDLPLLQQAILDHNFELLGTTAESNAIMMHKTMHKAKPAINYSLPETIALMEKVWDLRREGLQIYFTQDAGPNLKLLFQKSDTEAVLESFPEIEVLAPFADPNIDEVILVDKNDKAIGTVEKMEAHKKAQLHRAFSVVVYRKVNDKTEILLQQRQHDKYHCGGLWTNTCCSHPRPGEDIISAAKRRLQEEMGFVANLIPIGKFYYKAEFANGLTEHELDNVLIGTATQTKFDVNINEVADYKWIELLDLEKDLEKNPDKYTLWFGKVFDQLKRAW